MRMGGVSLLDIILIFVLAVVLVGWIIFSITYVNRTHRGIDRRVDEVMIRGADRGKGERAARGPQKRSRPLGFHLRPRRVVFKGVHKEFWTSDNRVHDVHQYEAEAYRTWLRLRPNPGFRVLDRHWCRKRGWHNENRKQGE